MPRLLIALLGLLLCAVVTGAQEGPLNLTRVTGLDGKPWPVKASRKATPELETFDAPYVLTPGMSRPALWYLERDRCAPVTYTAAGARTGNFEVVRSGGSFFFTYATDGVNEFWKLDGDSAAQVTLDGKPFHQRARITRGGDATYIYTGDFEGNTSLYEVKDGVASAIKLDDADRGTISFAWAVGGRLLTAFYKDGTYDFHVYRDGKFSAAWERNGEQDYDRQVDSITELRAGELLFLDIRYRDATRGAWVFDGAKLEAVEKHWGDAPVTNEQGVYFIDGALKLAEGARVKEIKLPGTPTSLSCRGGGVLAKGEKAAWLVSGDTFTELAATAELVAHAGGDDVLRTGNQLEFYRKGKSQGAIGTPDDFGTVHLAWQSYLVEQGAEDSAFRLWYLR